MVNKEDKGSMIKKDNKKIIKKNKLPEMNPLDHKGVSAKELHNLTIKTSINAIRIAQSNSSGAFALPPAEKETTASKIITKLRRPVNVQY